jgi:hypothetical protein
VNAFDELKFNAYCRPRLPDGRPVSEFIPDLPGITGRKISEVKELLAGIEEEDRIIWRELLKKWAPRE